MSSTERPRKRRLRKLTKAQALTLSLAIEREAYDIETHFRTKYERGPHPLALSHYVYEAVNQTAGFDLIGKITLELLKRNNKYCHLACDYGAYLVLKASPASNKAKSNNTRKAGVGK